MRSILIAVFITIVAQAEAAEFFVLPGTKSLLVMGETRQTDVQTLRNYIQNDKIDSLILNHYRLMPVGFRIWFSRY